MEEWKEYRYTDLATIIGGGTPKTSVPEYWSGEIPWLSVKDFVSVTKYVYDTEKHISELGLLNSSTKLLEKNDIVISARGTVGAMAMIPYPMCFNQSCFGLRGNNIVDKNFLYYLTRTKVDELRKTAHGSVFDTITRETFDNLRCLVPPLQTQQKIGNILSSLDSKIELNKRINDNLEQQAQALFNEMFPHITEGENMIGDLIMPKRGKGLLSKNAIKGDIPVVAGGIEPATYHNQANTTAPVLTIAASGANAGYINLWNIPVWASDSSYIDESITPNVYFWYVMLNKRQKEIFDAQVGSAQPHIYPKHIAELPLNNVPVEKITEYNNIVTSMFEKRGQLVLENKRLTSLRDILLPKLMSGELKINEINN